MWVEDFDGYLAVIGVESQMDDAHPALAKSPEQSVGTDPLRCFRCGHL